MWIDLVLILVLLLAAYYTGVFKGAPFVPTHKNVMDEMINLAEIRPGEKLADLGSGDGRILIAAAKAGAIAHGYEINPVLVIWSLYKIHKAGVKGKAFVHWKNFWRQDFSDYDIITVFGIGEIMAKLEQKLKPELKPGARVVSNIFKFPNWEGIKTDAVTVYRK